MYLAFITLLSLSCTICNGLYDNMDWVPRLYKVVDVNYDCKGTLLQGILDLNFPCMKNTRFLAHANHSFILYYEILVLYQNTQLCTTFVNFLTNENIM